MPGGGRKKGDGRGRMGGRKAGTPNKKTKEVREFISGFVNAHWADMEKAYKDLKPAEKCALIKDLLSYIAPKMSSVEYKGEVTQKSFRDELDEISGEKTRE